MRVFLHIDQLSVRGYRHRDAHLLAESLRTELAAQFADGASASLVRTRVDLSVRTAITPESREAGPAQLGVQAARSVARGLKS
jgi:hypothetical protein